MSEKLFPIAMIFLDLAAGIVYLWKKDFWMFGYWISAAVLTVCVTFRT